MCTAIVYKTKDHYFGRNLDLEYYFQETVTITPRRYSFSYRKLTVKTAPVHYAIIGMAYVQDNYPLYYDATNERGLSMAGLNFPGNAIYQPFKPGLDNITPFELIPWILSQCVNVQEAKALLKRMNLVDIPYSESLPLTPLHWIIADKECAITVEAVSDGIKIYDNPIGVLTNNPPFDYQMFHLNHFMSLSIDEPAIRFGKHFTPNIYSRGLGALGLPGDLSSMSRFVKAAYTKLNALSGDSENESISQFFHILGAVEQQRGCVRLNRQHYEITVYTSCCNTDKGRYYYRTYENSQIACVDMHREDLNTESLISYPIYRKQQIWMQNG